MRSVNGKSLEVRLRLPPGFEAQESSYRKRISASLSRGNVQVALTLEDGLGGQSPALNHKAAAQLLSEIEAFCAQHAKLPKPVIGDVLAVRGIVEFTNAKVDPEAESALHQDIELGLIDALLGLLQSRAAEGRLLSETLVTQISQIEQITAEIESDPSQSAEHIRARIERQLAELNAAVSGLDQARLHQEVALLATKADIREELDRLRAHIVAAGNLLSGGGVVGRKLEFLVQEFNREANTICSKSNAITITECGLHLKHVIDQMREQVQNLE